MGSSGYTFAGSAAPSWVAFGIPAACFVGLIFFSEMLRASSYRTTKVQHRKAKGKGVTVLSVNCLG